MHDDDPLVDSQPRLRFGLRSIFWVVTGCGIVLGIGNLVGPVWGLALAVGACVIVAHIAGNAIGSHLRDASQTRIEASRRRQRLDSVPGVTPTASPLSRESFAPVTRLSHRTSLGWISLVFTVTGGIVGGALGAWGLYITHRETASMGNLAIGGLACGVLAAIVTFWIVSLIQVFLGAWWQAHRHSARD